MTQHSIIETPKVYALTSFTSLA